MRKRRIPENLFEQIKKEFPFSCVDAILIRDNQFLLVKRKIPPYKNKWSLPGGIIKRGQKIKQKLMEVGREELGVKFVVIKELGTYEKIYNNRHDISRCFLVKTKSKNIKLNFQASDWKFFNKIPKNTGTFHVMMLKEANFS